MTRHYFPVSLVEKIVQTIALLFRTCSNLPKKKPHNQHICGKYSSHPITCIRTNNLSSQRMWCRCKWNLFCYVQIYFWNSRKLRQVPICTTYLYSYPKYKKFTFLPPWASSDYQEVDMAIYKPWIRKTLHYPCLIKHTWTSLTCSS